MRIRTQSGEHPIHFHNHPCKLPLLKVELHYSFLQDSVTNAKRVMLQWYSKWGAQEQQISCHTTATAHQDLFLQCIIVFCICWWEDIVSLLHFERLRPDNYAPSLELDQQLG